MRRSTNPHAWYLADLAAVPRNGMRVMSTFACGGGSSMGYKLAGFDVVAANDIDPQMAEHYKRNLHPEIYYLMPIGELVELARARKLPDVLYDLDILDGSPPCSSFSTAGKRDRDWGTSKHFREGQVEQVLDDLFFDYLNLVGELRPKVSVAENVKGIVMGKARGYTRMILDRYRELGYRVQVFLLNAADCGVPQTRERVFFVAIRQDLVDEHGIPPLKLDPREKWVTVREAIADLPPIDLAETASVSLGLGTQLRGWWERTAPGELFREAVVRSGGDPKLYNWRRYHPDMPGFTLTAFDCTVHWDEPRRLTFSERVRIGSFPEDYVVDSKKVGRYMVGMSVPPPMARLVAEAVRDQWLAIGESQSSSTFKRGTSRREVWDRLAPGETARMLTRSDRIGPVQGQFNAYRRLHPDEPAGTMTTHGNLFHPDEPRVLSAAEAARVGSFPDDYEVCSAATGSYMVGMSVPPRMAQTVADAVHHQWLDVAGVGTSTRVGLGKLSDAYDRTSPGEGLQVGAKRLGLVNRDGSGMFFNYRRAHYDLPSPTVMAQANCLLRPDEPRSFSPAELARLQSFPNDYAVRGPRLRKVAGYVIGMSVPPRMLLRLAVAVLEQWLVSLRPASQAT